jgi:hypothetical protein
MRRLLLLASVLLVLFAAVVLPRPAQAAPLSKPVITVQPADKTVRNDEPVTMRAHATGNPEPTVAWEYSQDGGKTFTSSGPAKDTLELGKSNPFYNGLRFRATFSNSQGTVTTNTVILTVLFRPMGTLAGPVANQSVKVGGMATFMAVSIGNPKPTVQWQVKPGNKPWADIPGATTTDNTTSPPYTKTSYTTQPAQLYANGFLFRAKFTNMFGSEDTNAATLTVTQ